MLVKGEKGVKKMVFRNNYLLKRAGLMIVVGAFFSISVERCGIDSPRKNAEVHRQVFSTNDIVGDWERALRAPNDWFFLARFLPDGAAMIKTCTLAATTAKLDNGTYSVGSNSKGESIVNLELKVAGGYTLTWIKDDTFDYNGVQYMRSSRWEACPTVEHIIALPGNDSANPPGTGYRNIVGDWVIIGDDYDYEYYLLRRFLPDGAFRSKTCSPISNQGLRDSGRWVASVDSNGQSIVRTTGTSYSYAFVWIADNKIKESSISSSGGELVRTTIWNACSW